MPPVINSLVTNSMGENAYTVCIPERGEAFVVDPGGGADRICALCAAQGCHITDILLTHGHFDHIGALAELKRRTGARIHIHPHDAAMLTDVARSLGQIGRHRAQTAADYPLSAGESSVISICGLDITALHTPGHTAGSVSYYLPEAGVLFSGDTLFYESYGRTDFPTGSMAQMRRSLIRLFQLPAETRVLPGHGPETTISHEVTGI